jgi:hypothetical protein
MARAVFQEVPRMFVYAPPAIRADKVRTSTPAARQQHASSTPAARQQHASSTPAARQQHASRTPAARQQQPLVSPKSNPPASLTLCSHSQYPLTSTKFVTCL